MKLIKRAKRSIWLIFKMRTAYLCNRKLFKPQDSWGRRVIVFPTRKKGVSFVVVEGWFGKYGVYRSTATMLDSDAESFREMHNYIQWSRWGSVPRLSEYRCRFRIDE